MLKTHNLFRGLCETKWQLFALQVKEISVFPSLFRNLKDPDYLESPYSKSPLWFTNFPSSKKRARALLNSKKVTQKPVLPTGDLIIECKNDFLNHYRGTYYHHSKVVPLASKDWTSRKAKNDFFTILPTSEHPAMKFPISNSDQIPKSFKDAGVVDVVIEELLKMGIESPTVIQAKTIPLLLDGKQVLVAADTGSGKTLAYLIPVVQKILQLKSQENFVSSNNSPLAVVIVHTKELSIQTGMVAEKLCSGLGLKTLTLLGGKAKSLLKRPAFEPLDLVVTSLGVFIKLLRNQIYSLEKCKIFVADEVDSLLDDTFIRYFEKLLSLSKLNFTPSHPLMDSSRDCQLCLVSATMPRNLENFSHFLPVALLENVTTNQLHKVQPHLPQLFLRLKSFAKPEKLLQLVKTCIQEKLPTIIFCNSTQSCDWVSNFLNSKDLPHIKINGKMLATVRLTEYEKFRNGQVHILCTTDVFARGMDFPWVKRVINYDFPKHLADYVHRCGRTGRIGHTKNCKVISLVSKGNEAELVKIIEWAVRKQSEIPNINSNIREEIIQRAKKHAAKRSRALELVPEIETNDSDATNTENAI